jgi:hypothetical protein
VVCETLQVCTHRVLLRALRFKAYVQFFVDCKQYAIVPQKNCFFLFSRCFSSFLCRYCNEVCAMLHVIASRVFADVIGSSWSVVGVWDVVPMESPPHAGCEEVTQMSQLIIARAGGEKNGEVARHIFLVNFVERV